MDRTASSLHRAATAAGYTVTIDGNTITGLMHRWAFVATRLDRGWRVLIRRPGWPVELTNTVRLRATLKAQTPADLGRVPR